MAYSFPSGTNTFIPSFDTTGRLIVDFSRNVKSFKVNNYITLTPVKQDVGYYARMDTSNVMRILGVNAASAAWADGSQRPVGTYNARPFEFEPYRTQRFCETIQLGYKAVEQAAFDVKNVNMNSLAQRQMTRRTLLTNNVMLDSTQYDSTHVATATALGGGFFSAGSVASPYIQAAVMAAANIIQKDTGGSVMYQNMTLVFNPITADKMARSAEIRDYLARSPAALAQVRGAVPGQNAVWGLPDQLYGIAVVVEDAVYNSSEIGNATQTVNYTFSDNYAVLMIRRGKDLVDVASTTNFSTMHIMAYQEMNTETFDDTINRLHTLAITDDYVPIMVAPASGFLITNLFS